MSSPRSPGPVSRVVQAITSWLGGLFQRRANQPPHQSAPPQPAPPRPTPPQPRPTPPTTPPAGKTLVAALGAQPDVLDPHRTTTHAGRGVLGNVYDTLTALGPVDLTVQPGLATGWSTSADGLQWRFALRSGVTFHDGSTLDSGDVVYSLDRITGQRLAAAAGLGVVDSVAADGPSTVVITLKQPAANLPALLGASPGVAILPAGAAEQHDLTTTAVGTGPFRLISSDADHTVLHAFDQHWRGRPTIGGVEFRYLSDPSAALSALRAGQVQWTDTVPPGQLAALGSDPTVHLESVPSVDYWYLTMNFTRKPFDDIKLRQALAYAIDAQLLVRTVLQGTATPNQTAIPRGSFFFYDYSPHPPNQTLAKALVQEGMQEQGYASVATLPPIRLTVPDGPPEVAGVATVVQQVIQSVLGITMRLETVEPAVLLDRAQRGDFEVLLSGSTGSIDPVDFYQARQTTNGALNYQHYSDPQVDQLLQQGATTTDAAARKQAYDQAVMLLTNKVSYAYLYNTDVVQAWAPGLSGYQIRADRDVRFGGVTLV